MELAAHCAFIEDIGTVRSRSLGLLSPALWRLPGRSRSEQVSARFNEIAENIAFLTKDATEAQKLEIKQMVKDLEKQARESGLSDEELLDMYWRTSEQVTALYQPQMESFIAIVGKEAATLQAYWDDFINQGDDPVGRPNPFSVPSPSAVQRLWNILFRIAWLRAGGGQENVKLPTKKGDEEDEENVKLPNKKGDVHVEEEQEEEEASSMNSNSAADDVADDAMPVFASIFKELRVLRARKKEEWTTTTWALPSATGLFNRPRKTVVVAVAAAAGEQDCSVAPSVGKIVDEQGSESDADSETPTTAPPSEFDACDEVLGDAVEHCGILTDSL